MSINNKSRYYASLIKSFIYPDYIKYIKDSLSNYYNIKFTSEDNRIKIKVKFNYFDIIYKKPLDFYSYHIKINFYIPLIDSLYDSSISNTSTKDNKFTTNIYPYNKKLNNINNINKSIESLYYSPSYLLDNSFINKCNLSNKYGIKYKPLWCINDANRIIEELTELNKFLTYIKESMIPNLCTMWYDSLNIILQKPKE